MLYFFRNALLLLTVVFCFSAFVWNVEKPTPKVEKVNWLTWQEAVKLNKKNPKKIFVDVYTDWCGWCKKMDRATFQNPKVAKYLADNFYTVKFDAEQKTSIVFNGTTFSFIKQNKGRKKGVHALAAALLDGKMSYPSIVYLNEKFERIATSPGYKTPDMIMKELKFAADERYKTASFEEFIKSK